MIYVSSSCVKAKTIKDAVLKLRACGFFNIELSSGTQYYTGLKNDLLELADKYDLNFLLHNYFPPPKKHFVINLASLDDSISKRSLASLKSSLDLCSSLRVKKFSFHAGFFMDIRVSELGKQIPWRRLYDKDRALEDFCGKFMLLKKYAPDIKLYLENNVFSPVVRKNYPGINPLMLTNYSDYLELRKMIDFNLLIDVAHLKVSCGSLGLDFSEQLNAFMPHTDYLHISDVGKADKEHCPFTAGSRLLKSLRKFNLTKKTITLEMQGSMDDLKHSYQIARKALS